MIIYGDLASGNCLKVKYTADYLGLPYRWAAVDITKGESRTPEALRRNPMGQVPAIELDDGRCLAQSNAIVRFLARGSSLLPEDAFVQGKIDELLFWEQYSHEPYIAVCRFHMFYLGRPKEAREPQRVERGEAALDLMEKLLTGRDWLVGPTMTIADIALLAYTGLAHEGGFDLAGRPAVAAWIARGERALGARAYVRVGGQHIGSGIQVLMGKITGILEFERSDRHYQPVEERIKHWREFVLPLPEEDNKKQAARCMDCAKAPVELTKSETDQVAGGAPTGDPGNAYGAGRGWGHDGLGGNGRGWLKSNDNGRPSP